MLTPESLPALQALLAELELDGWLLADFQGTNPIAVGVIGLEGMLTRRHFAWVPARGLPVALLHAIEPWPWQRWPAQWHRSPYIGWDELDGMLAGLVAGRRVAMEYSPGNGIPYLDRIPAGLLERVRAAGADVRPSADLVTRYYASWSTEQLASHRRAAEHLARIGRESLTRVGEAAARGVPLTEHELLHWVIEAIGRAGLVSESPPMVAAGANAADVHYQPGADRPRPMGAGDVVLVDLWAREPGGIYADQTWMGALGAPSARVAGIWDAVRAARDASISLLVNRLGQGRAVRGADLYEAARKVLAGRGLAPYSIGRAGHSIDPRQVHGAGPNLDGIETRDDRLLVPGIGFSIEPGVYIAGELGMRTEVNAFIAPDELIITPRDYQRELIVV